MSKGKRDSELDWEDIRTRFLAGESPRSIALDHGTAHTRVLRRATQLGWIRSPEIVKERAYSAPERVPGVIAREAGAFIARHEDRAAAAVLVRRAWVAALAMISQGFGPLELSK